MRLLILDQFSDPGGAQQVLLDLLPAIRDRDWRALVALPGNGKMFQRVRDLGFEAEQIACGPYRQGRKSVADAAAFLWQKPRLARQIRLLAKRVEADLIYCNGPRLLPALVPPIPTVFHSHSYLPPGPSRSISGAALKRTGTRVIANCEFVAKAWLRYVSADRMTVVYNGVEGTGAPVRRGNSAPVVACIGRISPEKGQLEFLAAAEGILRAFPSARFEIIGGSLFPGSAGYEEAVRSAAARLPVEFRGWTEDVQGALSGIDLLLVPSGPNEATTRVILEAYAAGVPVVAFRSGGIPEVLEDGVTGRLARSASEMSDYAIDILRDSSLAHAFAQAAVECWRRRFTLERFRRETLSVLEQAAGSGRGPLRQAPAPPPPPASNRIRIA